MISTYVFFLGVTIFILGVLELAFPQRIFSLWRKGVSHRFFHLYGIFLSAVGFPLTLYPDCFMRVVIFAVGIVLVFTGPFILLYPEKIRNTFLEATGDMEQGDIRRFVYIDAVVRIILGIIFISCTVSLFFR